MQPSHYRSGRGSGRVTSGLRPAAAGVLVALSLASVAGCGAKSAGGGASAAGRSATPSVTSSPSATGSRSAASSPSARAQAVSKPPGWKRICAAARTTGITVKKAAKDEDSLYEQGCYILTGGSTYDGYLHVYIEVARRDIVQADFKAKKQVDWNTGFAFSGPARDKAVVKGVGHARLGRDYDDAYYAFFPKVQVAGLKSSQTDVSILLGNALISFKASGSQWHGPMPHNVTKLTPIGPAWGQRIIDQLADAMLALVKPKSNG